MGVSGSRVRLSRHGNEILAYGSARRVRRALVQPASEHSSLYREYQLDIAIRVTLLILKETRLADAK